MRYSGSQPVGLGTPLYLQECSTQPKLKHQAPGRDCQPEFSTFLRLLSFCIETELCWLKQALITSKSYI